MGMGGTRSETENSCLLPIEKGTCRGAIRKFAYDSTTNQCVPFTWSGCGGNRNRFRKKKACERACRTELN
ncbi:Kunitz/Bovine pancreatic trypsin inhibitor domain protein [Ancylostoma duodenale]|uniref:Kunitz/Bovine pancreatic trypsin inhibitor domain protein n=1 Tax=Ancylostoma duodenale TaxID=51022 RepID=A0A0C2D2Y7_9BILA|nr:Kunitz/Bovine pancreatic trypsin inhibitor domain protein [Ancylostoma duodenale]